MGVSLWTWIAFGAAEALGVACILWGALDYALHTGDEREARGGEVLGARVFIGALFVLTGVYRLAGG